MRVLLILVVALVLVLGGAFILRPLLQPEINDAERKRLVETGEISSKPVLREPHSMVVTFRGRSMHVRIADPGEGAQGHVILIHGLSTPSYVWRDYFKPLSEAGFLVAAPDLYGRGYSDRVDAPYSEQLFLSQIDDLIQALEAPRPVHLVGYSMGAAIALRYAASRPERVETVSVIAPAGFQCGASLKSWFTAPVLGDWLMTVLGPELLASGSANEWAQTKDPDHWRQQYWSHAGYAGYGPAILSTLRNFDFVSSCDQARAWGQVGRPTLAVFAGADALIPVAGAAKAQELMAKAKVVTVPDLGHAITYSNPEKVLPDLLATIKPPAPQPPEGPAPDQPTEPSAVEAPANAGEDATAGSAGPGRTSQANGGN